MNYIYVDSSSTFDNYKDSNIMLFQILVNKSGGGMK